MGINNISDILGSLLDAQLKQTNLQIAESFERLSTGRRINNASDDAAGLAIASRLESQVRGLAQAQRNAQLGVSKVQTADGVLESVSSDVQRIRELSVQAANGTLNDSDREAIQAEVDQLQENIDFTLGNAEFNSQKIFSGGTDTFQVSPDPSGSITITFPELSASSLGIDNIDVTTQEGAQNAISQSDDALDTLLSTRTEIGATQNRLESTLNSLSQTEINTLSSLSAIRDTNFAEEVIKQAGALARLESQLAVAAQVNKLNKSVLPLLFGE